MSNSSPREGEPGTPTAPVAQTGRIRSLSSASSSSAAYDVRLLQAQISALKEENGRLKSEKETNSSLLYHAREAISDLQEQLEAPPSNVPESGVMNGGSSGVEGVNSDDIISATSPLSTGSSMSTTSSPLRPATPFIPSPRRAGGGGSRSVPPTRRRGSAPPDFPIANRASHLTSSLANGYRRRFEDNLSSAGGLTLVNGTAVGVGGGSTMEGSALLDEAHAKIAELASALEEERWAKVDLKDSMETLKAEYRKSMVDAMTAELRAVNGQLDRANERNQALTKRVAELEMANSQLAKEVTEAKEEVKEVKRRRRCC